MHIVACYKIVPEDQDIAVNADRTLDLAHAEPRISLYDLNAVEAAVQLAAQCGESGAVTALSVGGRLLENSKARKDILSRGPDRLTLVVDPSLEHALPHEIARALAGALLRTEFDLVLCGEGSGDLYSQQVGLLAGELLGVPAINGVRSVTPGDGHVVVERVLEHEVEVLRIPLPAVLMLCADCNEPRIPGMKALLAAGKKPVTVLALPDVLSSREPERAHLASVLAPEQRDRRHVLLEGESDENLATFAQALRKALN